MEQIDKLRSVLPESVKASVVKNSLLRKATESTPFEEIGKVSKLQNMFVFFPEEEVASSYPVFRKWLRDIKRSGPQFAVKHAVVENKLFSKPVEIDEIMSMVPKKMVVVRLIQLLKSVPVRLVNTLRQIPAFRPPVEQPLSIVEPPS